MLSPQLRSDIQKLWDAFWSGGISNPLTAIEQITYLVFLKRIEDLDNLALRQAHAADIYVRADLFGRRPHLSRRRLPLVQSHPAHGR